MQVLNAYLTGNGPWTAWFGAPPKRTLVLTVRNPNNGPYVNPPLVLAIGNAGDTTTHEATTQNLSTIGADATKTYQIPVSFPAVSVGEHQVVGIVGNAGLSKSFKVQTWLFPWGLLVVILIVLELLLLAITRYFRERRRRKEEAEGAAGHARRPGRRAADRRGPCRGRARPGRRGCRSGRCRSRGRGSSGASGGAPPRPSDRRTRQSSNWALSCPLIRGTFRAGLRPGGKGPVPGVAAWEDRRGLPYDVGLI